MRKIVLSAALAGTALALSACSGETETEEVETTDAAEGETETVAVDTDSVLDASTASAEDLSAVDGVSPELADAIVAGQPYDSASALNAVLTGNVSEEEAATLRERIFVPIDLNTASAEDIALIPGMTDRMVGEFLEYQPYADMAEFEREIGKYVDADEVARFQRYITLSAAE
ncbi:hypothetical protein [Aurantiacibacter aquimixticola]|uniref:Helix-hairpin-helix domain-containing protein n=1 Tax=Aurantiacibacter aquimixticola TaxID=1958945 RepID=A0A419RRQ6_9SPHN|nr:hypothetical protein [Aurantiacibacter aquimixticola]RJY08444.1 hypothetical protein D6201_02895 [Aurantiacibacter aquimixticola]